MASRRWNLPILLERLKSLLAIFSEAKPMDSQKMKSLSLLMDYLIPAPQWRGRNPLKNACLFLISFVNSYLVSISLLESISKLYLKFGYHGTIIDDEVMEVKQLPEFAQFCKDTSALQSVNLEKITKDSEKKAFWLNVVNVMYLHGIALWAKKPGKGCCQFKPKEKSALSSLIKYNIGGTPFSALEIEYGILRNGLCIPDNGLLSSFLQLFFQFQAWTSQLLLIREWPHWLLKRILSSLSPFFQELLYTSTNLINSIYSFFFLQGGPSVFVYKSDSVDSQIEENTKQWFKDSSHISNNPKIVWKWLNMLSNISSGISPKNNFLVSKRFSYKGELSNIYFPRSRSFLVYLTFLNFCTQALILFRDMTSSTMTKNTSCEWTWVRCTQRSLPCRTCGTGRRWSRSRWAT